MIGNKLCCASAFLKDKVQAFTGKYREANI